MKRDGVDYRKLEANNECQITTLDSGIIDYDDVVDWIVDYAREHDLKIEGICYDPANANAIITKLEKIGYPMVEVRQGTMSLNMPTRQFKLDVFDGKVKHNGNVLLTNAINNAYLKYDNNGVMIDKKKNNNKIDPIAALIFAYESVYDLETDNTDYNEYYKSESFSF
ncbi:hypothetical protein CHH53_03990 [Terribacillus sp. 7520-G]|nr:hypothetical protein CHH53_03990 [Terribacillus sp. 7520-G]